MKQLILGVINSGSGKKVLHMFKNGIMSRLSESSASVSHIVGAKEDTVGPVSLIIDGSERDVLAEQGK